MRDFFFFGGSDAAYAAALRTHAAAASGSATMDGGRATYSFIGRPGMGSNAAPPAAMTSARSSSESRSIIVSCHTPANMLPPVKYAGQPNMGR